MVKTRVVAPRAPAKKVPSKASGGRPGAANTGAPKVARPAKSSAKAKTPADATPSRKAAPTKASSANAVSSRPTPSKSPRSATDRKTAAPKATGLKAAASKPAAPKAPAPRALAPKPSPAGGKAAAAVAAKPAKAATAKATKAAAPSKAPSAKSPLKSVGAPGAKEVAKRSSKAAGKATLESTKSPASSSGAAKPPKTPAPKTPAPETPAPESPVTEAPKRGAQVAIGKPGAAKGPAKPAARPAVEAADAGAIKASGGKATLTTGKGARTEEAKAAAPLAVGKKVSKTGSGALAPGPAGIAVARGAPSRDANEGGVDVEFDRDGTAEREAERALYDRPRISTEAVSAHPDAMLTPYQVDLLYEKLVAERNRVLVGHDRHLSEALADSTVMPDETDMAQRSTEQAYLIRFADKERKLLTEIEHAIEKMRDGEYGLCEGTDEAIGFKRLELRPWTRYSVGHKEQMERERSQHRR
jgi:RNA polymerase-binding protein DksA